MTKNYASERYIPKHLNTKIRENNHFDFYYNNNDEKPECIAFAKKAKNKLFWYRFKNVEQMNQHINNALENAKTREEEKAKYKAERLKPHTLKVGDILYTSWGYDQTNIDFYKVVKLVGKTSVKLCAMSNKYLNSDCRASDKVVPGDVKENAEPFLKRVNGKDNHINISSFEFARVWDGNAKYQTAAGFGH
tara:strand:+ start:62 stop:634 length:573 start_codon:yes stop_codon:yes gene_type:complete